MAVVLGKLKKRWTYEEYYRLDDEQRYEIIDGELLMAPTRDTWHQEWLSQLNLLLSVFIKKNKLGRVFIAPVDVVLDQENTVQPDLIFVATANLGIVQRRALFGVPELLVEMVSPSSVRRDRYIKRDLYARFGVQEYWVGDPANRAFEVWSLSAGRYEFHSSAEERGLVSSKLLREFQFDLSELQ